MHVKGKSSSIAATASPRMTADERQNMSDHNEWALKLDSRSAFLKLCLVFREDHVPFAMPAPQTIAPTVLPCKLQGRSKQMYERLKSAGELEEYPITSGKRLQVPNGQEEAFTSKLRSRQYSNQS